MRRMLRATHSGSGVKQSASKGGARRRR